MNVRAVLCVCLALTWSLPCAASEHRGARFFGWADFSRWQRSETGSEQTWCSPVFDCEFRWDELVLSWNAETPSTTGLRFGARAFKRESHTGYYILGLWTETPGTFLRQSVAKQKDNDGEVRTDTLVLREPRNSAQVRVTLNRAGAGGWPRLRFLGAVVSGPVEQLKPLAPDRSAWGRTIDVPCRSQVDYPEGISAWCSPTCVSMLLAHWARVLKRPELDKDVPTVARGVHDPVWGGTGNWSFNTAYAGSFPGLRAYVTRLSDVSEIEAWVARDVPVVASVCYDTLRGRPRTRDSGHLVIIVGFTNKGDVVANDPGTRQQMRRTFTRTNFTKAWAHSNRTVYMIYPSGWRAPRDRFGHWFGR